MLAFLGVSVLLIVTPGPDMALTLRSALFKGRRGGLATASGVATGQSVWALASAVGLAALVAASEPAFVALRVAGALYLVYLGIEALRGSARAVTPRPGSAYRQGLLCNLANPKMAVFCVSLLPQFASPSFGSLLAHGLIFAAITFTWLTLYTFVVARLGSMRRVRRAIDTLTGVVLISLGLRVAIER